MSACMTFAIELNVAIDQPTWSHSSADEVFDKLAVMIEPSSAVSHRDVMKIKVMRALRLTIMQTKV